MAGSIVSIPYIIFGIVAIATYALLVRSNPYDVKVRNRIKELEPSSMAIATAKGDDDEESDGVLSRFVEELQQLNPSHASSRSGLQHRLTKAGIYDQAAIQRYYIAKLLFTAIPAAAMIPLELSGYISAQWMIPAAVAAGAVGFLVPGFWLDRAIARQHVLLQKSLPDFIDLMTVCLGGGLSLQQTIHQVSDELLLAHPELAAELAIIQRDMELGATVDQALKRFAVRTDFDGARTLSTFIREAQRFGSNIVDALRNHADMLRTKREQAAEEKAQKASVKILIPTLLLIFPAIFVILVGPAAIQIQEAFINQ
ncbi:type II secretion system F family protein [Symmachiella dynata]|uniref:type II secretion system F family protein n=1 Tax=Symmachiella dynata TaxID=2527995 RepID=UPI0030ECA27D